MTNGIMAGYLSLYRLAWRTYFPGSRGGVRRSPRRLVTMSLFLPVLLAVQTVHVLCLLLDDLLFRGYRQLPVRSAWFVVGVPRSGTTFLHRLLARDERFTTFPLWELIFAPAICQKLVWLGIARLDRCLGSPCQRLLGWVERRAFGGLDAVHATSLQAAEEDYLALLPIGGCFLLTLPFPFPDAIWPLARFDELAPKRRRQIMQFYRGIVQRHLYVRGADKWFLSKNPAFSGAIHSLAETFPGCRIAACLRDPREAVPSLLSSMTEGARLFANPDRGESFREPYLRLLEGFYQHLGTLPTVTAATAYVPYDSLTRDAEQAVRELYQQLDCPLSGSFATALSEAAHRSKGYRSRHSYSLQEFELSEELLAQRFQAAYETCRPRANRSPDSRSPNSEHPDSEHPDSEHQFRGCRS